MLIGLFGGIDFQGCRDSAPTGVALPTQTEAPRSVSARWIPSLCINNPRRKYAQPENVDDERSLYLAPLRHLDGESRIVRQLGTGKPMQESLRYPMEREHLIDCIEQDRLARHTENHTCGFILRDVEGRCLFHLQHTPRAIRAHAR